MQFSSLKLPSRNWSIFFATTGSLISLGLYDRFKKKQILKEFTEKAKVLSLGTIETNEMPRKVLVFTSDGQYSKYVFSEFIKPIFDAAAIDYDLYEPRREGQVKEKIIELIQTGKEELEGKAKKKIEEANKKKTLLEKMFGSWERKLTPQEQHMLSFMERPKYCVDQSLIAVGAEGWTELLEGLDTGLRTNKPRKSEVVVGEGSEPNIENSEQKEAAMTIESEITQPNVEIPYGFELPALGFIPARQLNGWSLFPYRVYRWFLERKVLQVVGEEALRISFNEEKKKFVKEDFFFGSGTGLHGTTDIKTDNYENKLNLETMEKLQLIV